MKLGFSRQIFEKNSNTKFHKSPCSGSRVVPCGQTDGYDEANIRFSQFWQRAWNLVCVSSNVRTGPLFLKQTILLSLSDFNQNWNIYRRTSLNLSPWRSVSQSRFTSRTHSVPDEFNEYLIPCLVLSRRLCFDS